MEPSDIDNSTNIHPDEEQSTGGNRSAIDEFVRTGTREVLIAGPRAEVAEYVFSNEYLVEEEGRRVVGRN